MRTKTQKALILVAVAMIVISEVAGWIATIFGATTGLIGGVIVTIAYLYCARRAKASLKYYGWILVPTILFTVVPTALRVHEFLKAEEDSLVVQLLHLAPSLFGFVLPVALLLVVYFRMSKIDNSSPSGCQLG